ncbi:MAG: hypothetical protein P8X50_09055 [Maritimibacter sp.]
MPKLVRLYITQIMVGFGLSAIFVSALLYTNVANLWQLISTSDVGWIAVIMLFMFNGLVFSGVQFAIVIMQMEGRDDGPKGGRKIPVATNIPARIPATAEAPKQRHGKPTAPGRRG